MSSKIFRGILCSSMAVALAIASSPLQPSLPTQPRGVTNIVLVHGAWADGSSWSKVIPLLEEKGLNILAVQLPLTSLQDDAAATKRAIELAVKSYGGPILLVGHSYGGTVITEVGNTPDVAGLVFVAAFAPDQGESTFALALANPTPGGAQLVADEYQFYKLTQQGIYDDFAQTLSVKEKQKLFVTQGPIAGAAFAASVDAPAWRSKPNWFVVASDDRAISPQLEQMEAQRMNATTLVIPTCHVAMLAEPNLVADFIEDAAKKAGKIHNK